jgi:hypothetical protein
MDKDKKVFEIDTTIGKLVIRENWDPDYPGVSVCFKRPDGAEINISDTEVDNETGDVNVFVWDDPNNEDYSEMTTISREELLNEED